ncbi:TPA: IS3 family transposase [Vibrio parahaemolyticus]
MVRKGNCWETGCIESFFHCVKVKEIQYEPIMTKDEMRQTVFEFIEVDFILTSRLSTLSYLSPVHFIKQHVA